MSDETLVERVARRLAAQLATEDQVDDDDRAAARATLLEVADAVEEHPEDGVRADGLPATKDDVADWLREQAAEEGADE